MQGYATVVGPIEGGLELRPSHKNGNHRGDATFRIFYETDQPDQFQAGRIVWYSEGSFDMPPRKFSNGQGSSMTIKKIDPGLETQSQIGGWACQAMAD